MIEKIITATPSGYEAAVVEIETDVAQNSLPATVIVGLPDTIVQESKERVRSAIKYSSFQYPVARVSINLAPGDIPKAGSGFDLGIALSILLAAGLIRFNPAQKMFIGELALDGALRPVAAVLSMAIVAKNKGISEIFVPVGNAAEACLIKGLDVYAVSDLPSIINHLLGIKLLSKFIDSEQKVLVSSYSVDMSEVSGQHLAKRALLIAAAGFHNVRMVGSPGSGKTMLAKAMAGLLPELSESEIVETTNIYSLSGKSALGVIKSRPFRQPHHTASSISLIGGGAKPKPGEVSLAHNGVLFLDELPEFPRSVLEVLRQPLEDRTVTIARAHGTIKFPAKFILVAAQNPCHCGNYGDAILVCRCHPSEVIKYNKKISGPLLDRIDLHISVPRLKYSEFKLTENNQTTLELRELVCLARKMQSQRFKGSKTNSEMSSKDISKFCKLEPEAEQLLATAAEKYILSGRSINRILKIARTIADLATSQNIESKHLAESLQYRVNN